MKTYVNKKGETITEKSLPYKDYTIVVTHCAEKYPYYRKIEFYEGDNYRTCLDMLHVSELMADDINSGDPDKIKDSLEEYISNVEFHLNIIKKI